MTASSAAAHAGTARERPEPARPLLELARASGLRMVVLGASKDPNAKVTVVLVSERTGRAELVAKAATSRPAAVAVEREWQLLRSVRDLLPERLRRTLPVPVEMCELGGRPALVTSALEGTPLAVRYLDRGHTAARSTVATDFALAAAWLADVQEASVSGAHEPLRLAGDLVAPLQRRYPDERDDGPVVSGLLELDRRLSRAATARTVVHGDFWAGNLLVDAGRLSGVVDWEAAAVQGEPVRDLARFALSYALYLDRRTRPGRVVRGHPQLRAGCWGRPVEFALEGNGWFPEVFRDFLRAGLRRLDVSPAHWRDVALVGVAELAARSDDDVFARRHLDLFRRTVTA